LTINQGKGILLSAWPKECQISSIKGQVKMSNSWKMLSVTISGWWPDQDRTVYFEELTFTNFSYVWLMRLSGFAESIS